MKIMYLWHGGHMAHHVSHEAHHQVALPPVQHMGLMRLPRVVAHQSAIATGSIQEEET
jgi:hypothetical protein